MTKKIWILLTLMMVLPAMTLMASCAKKKVYSDASGTQASDDAARAAEKARQDALARQRGFDEQRLKDQAAGGRAGGGGLDAGGSATRSSFVSEDIYFEYDSAVLVPDARDVLKRKAEWMRSNSNVSVIVEGHTDSRGTVEYNIALGERRAESALSFLVDLGIPASRLTSVSYGKEKPIDPGQNEAAWAKNRRVHFEIKK
ncbi:MAG: peptidoglycan-associated lipoprotein Pal [Deltaproteobacteria bacterium]|nr:peptidoglycan-associated lipoprotein Pal [Deltaproteobacteria bacterium]